MCNIVKLPRNLINSNGTYVPDRYGKLCHPVLKYIELLWILRTSKKYCTRHGVTHKPRQIKFLLPSKPWHCRRFNECHKKPSSNLIKICLQTFCDCMVSGSVCLQIVSIAYELCQHVLRLFPILIFFFHVTFYESMSVFDILHVT